MTRNVNNLTRVKVTLSMPLKFFPRVLTRPRLQHNHCTGTTILLFNTKRRFDIICLSSTVVKLRGLPWEADETAFEDFFKVSATKSIFEPSRAYLLPFLASGVSTS
jgi:hypothetical protein